jgi:hypothetical protein
MSTECIELLAAVDAYIRAFTLRFKPVGMEAEYARLLAARDALKRDAQ